MKNYTKKGILTIIILLISSYFSVCTNSYNPNTSHIFNIELYSPSISERAIQANTLFSNSTNEIKILDITDAVEFTFESTHDGSYSLRVCDENYSIITYKSGLCVQGLNTIPFTLDPEYYNSYELYTIILTIDIPVLPGFFTKYSESTTLFIIPEETVLEITSAEAVFWKDLLEQEFEINTVLYEKGESTPVCSQNLSFYIAEGNTNEGVQADPNLKYIGSGITDAEGKLEFRGVRSGFPIPEFEIFVSYKGNHIWEPSDSIETIYLFTTNDYAFNIFDYLMKLSNYKLERTNQFYTQVQEYLENLPTLDFISLMNNNQTDKVTDDIEDQDNIPPESNEIVEGTGSVDTETMESLQQLEQDCNQSCFVEVQESIETHLTPIIKMDSVISDYSDIATYTANITTIRGRPLEGCVVDFYMFGHTDSYPSWLEDWEFLSRLFDYLWFFFYFYGYLFEDCNCFLCKILTCFYERIESYMWAVNIGSATSNQEGIAQINYPVFLTPGDYNNILKVDFSPLISCLNTFKFYKLFYNNTLIMRELTAIESIDSEIRYSDLSNLIFRLTDNEGNGIPQANDVDSPDQILEFSLFLDGTRVKIGEGTTSKIEGHTGEVEIFYTSWLVPGEYSIEVQFLGDRFYLPQTYSGILTVDPEYTVINCQNKFIGRYSDKLELDAWITDDEGNPLPQLLDISPINKEIYAYYSLDSTYASYGAATADNNGHAIFENDLYIKPGVYDLRFFFGGAKWYYPAYSSDSTLEILRENTRVEFVELNEADEPMILSSLTMKYSDPYLIEVMLQDNEYNLIPQVGEVTPPARSISILIDSTIVCSAGIGVGGLGGTVYTPSLHPGTYTITAEFNGDDWYSGTQKDITLLIEKEDIILTIGEYSVGQGNTVELTAILTDNEGNLIAGKSINFYKESTLIGTASTSSEGKAILSYTVPESEPVGIYTLQVEFLGDNDYVNGQMISSITIFEIITEMICPFCDGTGVQSTTTTCHACQGTGDQHAWCSACFGTGKRLTWVTCPTCGGNGVVEGKCWACGGAGNIWGIPCIFCGGDGKVNYLCPACLGFRVVLALVNCWDCGGEGIKDVACPVCGGTGQIEDDVPCICCTGDGILTTQESERFPQINTYTEGLNSIIQNFDSISSNLFSIVFIAIGILALLTLGLGLLLVLSLLGIFWTSLVNNPTKMDSTISEIVLHKDSLQNPTMQNLGDLTEDITGRLFDPVSIILSIIIVVLIVIIVICILCDLFYDQPYTGINLPAITGNPSKFAIIVSGGEAGGTGEPEMRNTAKHLYETLLLKGYSDDTIVYLNAPGTQVIGGTERADGISSQQNLKTAVDWVKTYADNTDTVLLYVIDHGSQPIFGMNYILLNTNNKLWDWEFANCVNLVSGTNYGRFICILEACFSGNFMDDIAWASDRITMTATDSSTSSYYVVGGEGIFSSALFSALNAGESYRGAFQDAVAAVSGHDQHPLLDDNGDKVGHQIVPGGGDGLDSGLANTNYL